MSECLNWNSGFTLRRRVNCSVFIRDSNTGHCCGQSEEETDVDITAIHTALNTDLILRKIFAYADFQTLKGYRTVQNSWRICANFEIHRRNFSRTFITPQNLPQILSDIRKNCRSWTDFPSCELVLEKIESDASSNYWSNVHQLFSLLCPPGQGLKSQVKGLTVTWPTRPNHAGPSKNVIHYFLQILQLVSSSLEELNVTHYLMAYQNKDDNNGLQPDLTFDLPDLRSIKILPRAASDIHYDHKPLTLTSGSLGLRIIQNCPNLEKVDNLHLEKFSDWPKYSRLVKNYVYYQPCFEDAWLAFSQAGFRLKSLHDSVYLFPYNTNEQKKRRENYRTRDRKIPGRLFLQILRLNQNTLKELRLGGNRPFNFSSPDFPPLPNLQTLQVKVGRGLGLPRFFNSQNSRLNPLPNLKTVSLVLEPGWENQVMVNFDPIIEYRSVTSLELCSEFANTIDLTQCPFNVQDFWLENLTKCFPDVKNLTLTNAVNLNCALPGLLGPWSKLKNLRSISFNMHLDEYTRYPLLGPIFRELVATPESRESLQGLRKMDIVFEDYFYTSSDVEEQSLISVEALRLFLNVLPDLQMTFHYNHSQCPQELLRTLRPLADVSPKISFRHLSRVPWARAVDAAFYTPPEDESTQATVAFYFFAFVYIVLLVPFFSVFGKFITWLKKCHGLSVAIFVPSVIEYGGKLFSWFKNAPITNNNLVHCSTP